MGRVKEDQELFNMEDVVRVTQEDYKDMAQRIRSRGAKAADKVTDDIMQAAFNIIRVKADKSNFDMDAEARKYGMSVDDYIQDSDSFYEIVIDLSDAYIDGMEEAWPHQLRNN